MATTRTVSRRARWQPEQIARLRRMAASRPVGLIAHELGRTESAVRSKAHQEGISFDSGGRARRGKPAATRRSVRASADGARTSAVGSRTGARDGNRGRGSGSNRATRH